MVIRDSSWLCMQRSLLAVLERPQAVPRCNLVSHVARKEPPSLVLLTQRQTEAHLHTCTYHTCTHHMCTHMCTCACGTEEMVSIYTAPALLQTLLPPFPDPVLQLHVLHTEEEQKGLIKKRLPGSSIPGHPRAHRF